MTAAEALTSLNAEAATYPQAVRIWMGVMAVSFFSGLLVALLDRRTLWIALAAAFTFGGLIVVRILAPDMPRHLSGALLHVILWPPALALLWRGVAKTPLVRVWSIWVSLLMGISLILDFRVLFQI